jgi:hypothetical protein
MAGFENDIQVLQSPGLCLDVEEVDEDELEQVPENEEDIEPVSDLSRIVSTQRRISEAGD